MKGIVINTTSNGYGLSQVENTVTVKELISILSQYNGDTPVFLGNNRQFIEGWTSGWYTYGGITKDNIEEYFEEDEIEYIVCKEWWSWDDKDFIDSDTAEVLIDREDAIETAIDLNKTEFCAWSDLKTGKTVYTSFCIKAFDESDNLVEVIDASDLGIFEK